MQHRAEEILHGYRVGPGRLAAVGRLKRGAERELAEEYRDRAAKAGRAIGIRAVELIEVDESRARRAPDRMSEEAAALAARFPDDAVVIALDERGESLPSTGLAERLGRWRDQGRPTAVFVIGGPDGLADSVRNRAELCVAFGRATWPHQLARTMLFEQLYRVVAILSGHPYHRA